MSDVGQTADAPGMADIPNAPDTGMDTNAEPDGDTPSSVGLPVLHEADPQRARAGLDHLERGWFGPGLAPRLGVRHVYLSWPGTLLSKVGYVTDDSGFWAAFRERYGFEEAPWDNAGLPLGLRPGDNGMVSIDCLACHAGRVPGGQVRVGLGSGRVDIEGLHDDLVRLPEEMQALQEAGLPEPYGSLIAAVDLPEEIPAVETLDRTTGAAGASDGFGMGVALGFELLGAAPELHRRYGFQDPPAWFTHRFKSHMYTDGSVEVGAHRTMMATLLASGMGWSDILDQDDIFADVAQAMWTLPVPRWEEVRPEPLDPVLVEAGRALFRDGCSSCHGVYEGPDAFFPSLVVPVSDLGTDPIRARRLGPEEANAINTLMADPDYPMTSTGGYLAPPLVGIWATAPYLHNGSVPDLVALLSPNERPALWQRLGSEPEHFDPERVGWRTTTPSSPGNPDTVEGRKIYDTSLEGLANTGHTYGQELTGDQRAQLIAYLKSL
ncbi:MAG: hypothetical protein AAFS10_20165 [Myxococcota bacterium]